MKKIPPKLRLGILLFVFGFIGILSILTMEIPVSENTKLEMEKILTPFQFKLLSLMNPTIMLIILVTVGTLVYEKVNFKLPFFEKIAFKDNSKIEWQVILKFGILGGILGGTLLTIVSNIFHNYIPLELEKFKPNVLNRFFYGGITEEILMRFGIMTFLVWILFKISKNKNSWIYWVGIIISSALFGLGHLPVVASLVSNPSIQLISYIILGNFIGGLIFGWLYWKKGLETAMIAHIFTHLVFLTVENL
ncbi:CPBP family intramembrane glutamic endopeptidase [Soonwooa sp.]|uniref:CPBP family intramembrane glutamic endopeptidase n=1 Tax=Soonwooa sp. TaxID=1938592 RepID=UPI002602F566|nr:CPBP family intramembrane glutamic endopeptidase [Soonwooa sp.]